MQKEPTVGELGDILREIMEISEGPDPKNTKIIPEVPVTIAFIGKPYTGKTSQAQMLADKYSLQIINIEESVKEAISAYEKVVGDDGGMPEKVLRKEELGELFKKMVDTPKKVCYFLWSAQSTNLAFASMCTEVAFPSLRHELCFQKRGHLRMTYVTPCTPVTLRFVSFHR